MSYALSCDAELEKGEMGQDEDKCTVRLLLQEEDHVHPQKPHHPTKILLSLVFFLYDMFILVNHIYYLYFHIDN